MRRIQSFARIHAAHPAKTACRERRFGPYAELSCLPRGDSPPPHAEIPRTTITDVNRRNVLLASSVCLLAGISTATRGRDRRWNSLWRSVSTAAQSQKKWTDYCASVCRAARRYASI
jgi:hypothetical protein